MTARASRLAFPLVIWAFGPVAVLSPAGMVPLGLLGALLLLASPEVRRRLAGGRIGPLPILLAVFLLWAAAASLWAPSPPDSLLLAARVGGLLVAGLVYLAGLAEMDEPTRERAMQALAFAGPLLLLVLGFELLSEGMLARILRDWPPERRFDPEILDRSAAILAVFAFPFAAALRRRMNLAAATLFLVLSALHLFLVPMAAARLALALGGVLFLLAWRWPSFTPRALLGACLIGTLLVPPVFAATEAGDLMARAAWQLPGEAASVQHRLLINQFVLAKIAERPLAGFGFDSARRLPGGDDPALLGEPVLPLHPHNAIFQIWLELGAIGAVLLAALFVVLLEGIGGIAARGPRATACAAFTAFMTLAGLSFGIWQNWWVMLAWLAAATVLLVAKEEAG